MKDGCLTITEKDLRDLWYCAGYIELRDLVKRYGAEVPISDLFNLVSQTIDHSGYIPKRERNLVINVAVLMRRKFLEKTNQPVEIPTVIEQLSLPERNSMFGALLKDRAERYEQKLDELSKEMTQELNLLKQNYETEASDLEATYLVHILEMNRKITKVRALIG